MIQQYNVIIKLEINVYSIFINDIDITAISNINIKYNAIVMSSLYEYIITKDTKSNHKIHNKISQHFFNKILLGDSSGSLEKSFLQIGHITLPLRLLI